MASPRRSSSGSPTRPPGRSGFPAAAPSGSIWRRSSDAGARGGEAAVRLDLLAALNGERAARRAAILVTDTASGVERLVKAADVASDPLCDLLEKHLRMGKSGMAE